MRAHAFTLEPRPESTSEPGSGQHCDLGDLRFRALMSADDWASLPVAIRRRFSKRLAGGETAVYVGEIVESRMGFAG